MSFDRICGSAVLAVLAIGLALVGIVCIRDGAWWWGGIGVCVSFSLQSANAFWRRFWP